VLVPKATINSMRFNFSKMNGAGNDFIMFDNREGHLVLNHSEIAHLCDRHRGIGADGVLLLDPPLCSETMARMRYYNADGHEVDMCGNGARCFTRYAANLFHQTCGKIPFETGAGIVVGELLGDQVKICMSTPHSLQLHQALGEYQEIHSINTGVPHIVFFVEDLEHTPVIETGRAVRHHSHFAPNGTNVNFVKILEPNLLAIRTYERGVEDETLACGTGVVAAALVHHLLSNIDPPMKILVRGGETLEVDFISKPFINNFPQFKEVSLTGPANFVFEGSIVLNTP
jgi:diaminopimelate epimerase